MDVREQSIEIQFHGSSGDRSESLLQSSELEPSSEPAATTTGDITSDTGRQLGRSSVEFEDLVGYHGDGLWRRDNSPVISYGGTDDSREESQCDDPGWENDISKASDEQEALWESLMLCLFTTAWQKFNCAVLTVCTVPMSARSLTAAGRRHNEGVVRWNNILRNLASRNAGRTILMDIEHALRAMDQARLTTDGIHFDSIEGQAWLNRVFQERLDELEAELFATGILKEEGTTNDAVITTFVPPNL